jgi:integrase/recombinase XerD
MRLSDAAEGYWLANELRLRPATVEVYRWALARFAAFAADSNVVDLDQVTPDVVQAFLRREGQSLSRASLVNLWAGLSAFWTWAEQALGASHPIRGKVKRPKLPSTQPLPYSEDEVRRMLEACEWNSAWGNAPQVKSRRATALRDRAMLLVMVDTGLRASEVCGLLVGDYDRSTGRLLVRDGKGGKERAVFAGATARAAVWRYLVERRKEGAAGPDDPLFTTSSGRALTRSNLLHMVQRLASRAGVGDANLHRFRHTFAVTFLRNGGNIYALQALLGHHDLDMVRQYLRLVEADVQAAAKSASPADRWRL